MRGSRAPRLEENTQEEGVFDDVGARLSYLVAVALANSSHCYFDELDFAPLDNWSA